MQTMKTDQTAWIGWLIESSLSLYRYHRELDKGVFDDNSGIIFPISQ